MKKYITDELVDKLLSEQGLHEDHENTEEFKQKVVLDYFESTITDDWHGNFDYYIYEESTTDGYSVYVSTYDQRNISVNENVHYYDHDLGKELIQAIKEGISIYVEDMHNSYVDEAFDNLFEKVIEIKSQEIIDNLIDEGYEEQKIT
jgi:hypothetical protein|tara:strand:- start:487 stop:927 length:441 start_codon:yes stop_codon:yes gene_type:complete